MRKPIYVPKAKPIKSDLWLAVAEFATLVTLWGTILAIAVLARAIMGV